MTKTDIEALSDEDALKTFITFLETRIRLDTAFIPDEETGNLTHQVLQLSCGDYVTYSQPEPLDTVLRPATGAEAGVTVN